MLSKEERRAARRERLDRDIENKSGVFTGISRYAISRNGLDFEFLKTKERQGDDMHLDIIPYIIATENHPDVVLRPGKFKVGLDDYMLEYWRHANLGPEQKWSAVCLRRTYGKPCPVCEMLEANELEFDPKKDPKAKQRVLYNVIDRDVDPDKIMIFDVSYFLFHKELKDKLTRFSGGVFDFADPEDGKTVKFYARKSDFGGTEYVEFDFLDRQPYDDSIIEKAVSLDQLLNVLSYEDLRKLALGEVEGSTKDTVAEAADDGIPEPEPEAPVNGGVNESKDVCPFDLGFGVGITKSENKKTCNVDCPDEIWTRCSAASKNVAPKDDIIY